MDLLKPLYKYEIVHLNIRSARSNKNNLEVYLAEMNYPEIICLNETKLPKDAIFKIEVIILLLEENTVRLVAQEAA